MQLNIAVFVRHILKCPYDSGLHVQKLRFTRSRTYERRRRMPRRAVRENTLCKIDHADKERRKRLNAREAQKKLIQIRHHTSGPYPLPRICGKRGLDRRRHRGGLDALAGNISHNDARTSPRKPHQTVKITADKSFGRCGRINPLRINTINMLQFVFHARHQRLRDTLILLALLRARDNRANAHGHATQKLQINVTHGLGPILT